MQLNNLKNSNHRSRKRIGRGGKRGTTSGRGQKGQKSRSGRRLRPAQRDLILRLPKLRGYANKPKSAKPAVFNLSNLNLKLKSHVTPGSPLVVNKDFLKAVGLLPMNYRGGVKILGDGMISAAIKVEGIKVSQSAKVKIEKAGGLVQ